MTHTVDVGIFMVVLFVILAPSLVEDKCIVFLSFKCLKATIVHII